uniref:Transmembrane protein n=1 Tax=Trypanosoma vivax (strain Y486) TaxID=1055687 RepID=G0U3N8_TRYVY|nr:conserved hypothetical protein [Trypanosoma vivax Y486]
MVVIVREEELPFLFGVIVATLFLALVVHCAVGVVSNLPKWLVRLRWHYVGYVCIPVFLLHSLFAGLTWCSVVLAVALTMMNGTKTWQRRVTIFLPCLVISSLYLAQVTRLVQVEISPDKEIWVSRYSGQLALWPPQGGPGPQFVLVVYDNVVLAPSQCNSGQSGRDTNTLGGSEVFRNVGDPRFNGSLPGSSATLTLVSLGYGTHVRALEGCLVTTHAHTKLFHRISLLGAASRLEGTVVRCRLLPLEDRSLSGVGGPTCVLAAADAVMVDVVFELYVNYTFASKVTISRAASCVEAQRQFEQHDFPYLRESEPVLSCLAYSGRNDLPQFLENPTFVPAVLKTEVPYSLRCLWRLPDVLDNFRCRVAYVYENVVIPWMSVIAAYSSTVVIATMHWLIGVTAGALNVLEDAEMFFCGLLCRFLQCFRLSYCSKLNQVYASDRRRIVGFQVADTVSNAVYLTLDALEIVPGFWQVLLWTLRLEWVLTCNCLFVFRAAVAPLESLVFYLSLTGLQRVQCIVEFVTYRIMPISLFSALEWVYTFLYIALTSLCGLYSRLLSMETQLVWRLVSFLYTRLVSLVTLSFCVLDVLYGWLSFLLGLYTNTTFVAHMFVAFVLFCLFPLLHLSQATYGLV